MTAHRWHLCAVWQVMTHDWVTDEGSRPLPRIMHRKVQLSLKSDAPTTTDTDGVDSNPLSPSRAPGGSMYSGGEDERTSTPGLMKPGTSMQGGQTHRSRFMMQRYNIMSRASSFHNRKASEVSPAEVTSQAATKAVTTKVATDITANQKEHLRALRARQFNLLAMHTTLTTADRDVLLEQQRLPLHSHRATASIEEFVVDDKGVIASPTQVCVVVLVFVVDCVLDFDDVLLWAG